MPRLVTGAKIRVMARTRTVSQPDNRARARPGDWVVVQGHAVGEHERTGLILDVLGTRGHERYRVRWHEEHESIVYPGADATIRRNRSQ
jgi:hypothetical protein